MVQRSSTARNMLRHVAIAAFVVSLLPVAVFAQAAPVDRRDAAIFKDVAKQVSGYTRFTVFDDIQASVTQGVVCLYGKVTMPYKRDDIGRRVAGIAGVRQVVNKIAVLPVSQFDDDLRYQIARAIYGNPSFWHYASMVNPPIHIVVENGRVTLTGVVNNDVEKMLARSLATGSNAFSVQSLLKTDAEARADLEKVEKASGSE
jgi:hyperosmotically inducible periplasmic protein